MGRTKGPQRKDLVKKILRVLEKYPEGIWIRKLVRILKEPLPTVYKYVTTDIEGYPSTRIEIVKQLPQELGGHIMIKLKRREK